MGEVPLGEAMLNKKVSFAGGAVIRKRVFAIFRFFEPMQKYGWYHGDFVFVPIWGEGFFVAIFP